MNSLPTKIMECSPLCQTRLGGEVRNLIMEYHGGGPAGVPRNIYNAIYSGMTAKRLVDAVKDDILSWDAHGLYCIALFLKCTRECMLNLKRNNMFVTICISGICYPYCFVVDVAKTRPSIKLRNTIWFGKWVRLASISMVCATNQTYEREPFLYARSSDTNVNCAQCAGVDTQRHFVLPSTRI